MDDYAHEVGLGGGDGADSLGFGERRRVSGGEDWGQRGGVVSEVLLGSEQVLVRLGSLGDIARVLLFGGDREASDC